VVLEEQEKGLYFEGRVSKTQMGNEALELVKDGVVDGASIGFRTKRFERVEQDDEHGGQLKRIIKEIDLYEFSPVIWGANDMAFSEVEKAASELHEFYAQLKSGRVLNAEDRKSLSKAMALLQEVLESGKKSQDDEDDDEDSSKSEQEELEAKCVEWMGEEFLAELDSFTEQIA
jgi:hypothetical protein